MAVDSNLQKKYTRSVFLSALSVGDVIIVDDKEYVLDAYLVAHADDGSSIVLASYDGDLCVKFYVGEGVFDFVGCYNLCGFYVEDLGVEIQGEESV